MGTFFQRKPKPMSAGEKLAIGGLVLLLAMVLVGGFFRSNDVWALLAMSLLVSVVFSAIIGASMFGFQSARPGAISLLITFLCFLPVAIFSYLSVPQILEDMGITNVFGLLFLFGMGRLAGMLWIYFAGWKRSRAGDL